MGTKTLWTIFSLFHLIFGAAGNAALIVSFTLILGLLCEAAHIPLLSAVFEALQVGGSAGFFRLLSILGILGLAMALLDLVRLRRLANATFSEKIPKGLKLACLNWNPRGVPNSNYIRFMGKMALLLPAFGLSFSLFDIHHAASSLKFRLVFGGALLLILVLQFIDYRLTALIMAELQISENEMP